MYGSRRIVVARFLLDGDSLFAHLRVCAQSAALFLCEEFQGVLQAIGLVTVYHINICEVLLVVLARAGILSEIANEGVVLSIVGKLLDKEAVYIAPSC